MPPIQKLFPMRHFESQIQIACVNWFRYQHPKLAAVFFSVPNGGKRTATEAKILKAEGVVSGVSDLLLNIPNSKYTFLALECKTPTGKQTPLQKQWQENVEKLGAKYMIFRSVPEFMDIINDYLSSTKYGPKNFK